MAEKFQFDLISPERVIFSEQVESVILPGSEGFFTVLAKHMPLITRILPGTVRIRKSGGTIIQYINFGGFVEVRPERVSLMTESASLFKDIDKADIDRRIAHARNLLKDVRTEESRDRLEEFIYHMSVIRGVNTMG